MKRFVFIFGFWLSSTISFSQVTGDVGSAADINTIKRDTSFIYAESTMRDVVEAQSAARAILEIKATEWLRNRYPNENIDHLVDNISKYWADIISRRGNYSRVLAYVNKGDVDPNARQVIKEDSTEIPAITDEPVQVLEEVLYAELTPEEEKMAEIVKFDSIEPYIKNLKTEGRVHAYGKYASLPEDAQCYIFVYNRNGQVVAVLRQSEEGQHFNLQTLQDDNVRNYKNCGAIWLQLK